MILLRQALTAGMLLGSALPALAAEGLVLPETVRACPKYGPGFLQVPGSSTCLRIGGRVTSEYGAASRRIGRDQIAGFGTSARVSVDSRTDTDYGPLRAYVRMRAGTGTVQSR